MTDRLFHGFTPILLTQRPYDLHPETDERREEHEQALEIYRGLTPDEIAQIDLPLESRLITIERPTSYPEVGRCGK